MATPYTGGFAENCTKNKIEIFRKDRQKFTGRLRLPAPACNSQRITYSTGSRKKNYFMLPLAALI